MKEKNYIYLPIISGTPKQTNGIDGSLSQMNFFSSSVYSTLLTITMLRKKILLLLLYLTFVTSGAWAQAYPMNSSTVNTCSGTFYDSGGNNGNYGNNENFTMTFCAPVAGNCIRLVFTSFDIETNFDEMVIYDGPNTASPIIGTFTGNTSPGLITANSGCLTVVFTSDGLFNYGGWAATISCVNCASGACAVNCNGGPPPANDACSGAQNIGNLPVPSPCPGGIGALSVTNTTNLCATAETPYTSLLGCQPAGNMASPAADVWYRFTITGPSLNVNVSGGITTPNVGLYEGTSCASLIPRGCAVGSNGTLNTTFGGLAAGTYYLQVSGGSLTDQCTFTLTLQNNFDCAGCVIQSTLVANPPPVNGSYAAGQTVNFCYTISDYNQTSANWLHGVVPSFGPGWDMSTFSPAPVTDCSGSGAWNWYPGNVTSSATGNITGPGFYYESALGNPFAVMDGNPGNNFGDNNGTNNCDWTFCWSVKTLPVNACIQGASLNIAINTLGDGESGSWGSLACTQDPISNFFATLSCCQAPTVNVTNPPCANQNTGSATAQGVGNSPWDYVWANAAGVTILTQNNVAGSSTINNLAPGNYTVSVTDNSGCTSNSAFSITAPASFSAVMNTTNLTCNGNQTGTANVVVNGGSPGYSYAWSPAGSGNNPSNLGAGNYTVTVTDANGCTTTASGTITQPALLNASVTVKTNVTCNGGQDGDITVTTVGGTPAYSYSWSNGAAGNFIGGLGAGVYTVTVTDNNGCTGFMTVAITEPTAIVLNLSSTNASCGNANGSATVNALGGTPPYSYAWSPSGGSAALANNLTAGGYNVTVTDSRGCTSIGNVVVSNSSGPTASISASNDVNCFGDATGSATVTVSGGTAPVSYSWTPAGGNGPVAANLTAGNYTVTVSDGSGCTSSAAVIISEPSQLTASITANTPVSCSYENDGSLTAQANGGTPGYSYAWSGGSVNATDNNLLPGTYTVTVTDANGCTTSLQATVLAPAVLQASISNITPASCNGGADGSAAAQAVGGTPPYSFLWSNGAATALNSGLAAGTYTVTATDANGCTSVTTAVVTSPSPLVLNLSSTGSTCGSTNGTASVLVNGGTGPYTYSWNPTGGTGTVANNLASGNYSVVVTDANGCISIGNASVPSADGPVLTLNSSTMVSCPGGNNGSIDISVNGGAMPYTFNWSNGAPGTVNTNLVAGIYTLTVTDDNNCSAALSINITQPAAFGFNMTPLTAHCGQADGSVSVVVSGGTPAYAYQWSGGGSATNQLNNITSGTYTVTVTDANGCTAQSQGIVPDQAAPVLSINTLINASCPGLADGRIRVNVAGGTPPFAYLWSNGAVGQLNSNIAAGTYTVTVTDNSGCTAIFSATVNEPSPLVLVTNSTTATCGSNNGSAGVVVNGGTPGYQYVWIPSGGVSATALALGAGAYTVVVTDNHGCTEQANVTVPSSNGPSVAVLLSTDVSCAGGNDGDLTIAVNGGAPPYAYQWSSGGSGISGNNLSAGNYTVTVTDANNCSATLVAVINEPTAIVLAGNALTAHCGQSDGSADVVVNGGVPVYSYSWSTGTSTNNTISAMPAGSYTVTVTDDNGCTAQTTINIPDQNGPTVNIASLTNVSCNGGTNGSIGVAVANGNPPFAYVWSNGAPAAVNPNLGAGIYTVTVTDNFGCTSTLQSAVTEPVAIQLAFNNTTSTCGNSNGSSGVVPNGGTAPYSYLWSNGAITATAFSLAAGIYTVTVTDAGGCSVSDNTIINSAGGPVLAAGPLTDVSCAGGADGSASVIVVAGNGPFTFDWLPYGGTTASATGLSAGNYKVSVTDVNGCSTALNFDIEEPLPLVVNNLTTPASCNGGNDGTADIDAQGGTSPYLYDWTPGGVLTANRINLSAGNYDVTVTDDNGCTALTTAIVTEPTAVNGNSTPTNASCFGGTDGSADIVANGGTAPYTFLWSNGSTGTQISNLIAGTYTVTISDNNGCTQIETAIVGEAAAINLVVNAVDATCGNTNGSAQVIGNGGTGLLSYQWSTGTQGSGISNLAAGAYTVIATDANGCTQTGNTTVADMGGPSVSLANANDATCNGTADGSAEITINSGNGPYTYQWLPSGGTAAIATGLSAGAYSVTVTDVNGCISSMNVSINEPAVMVLQVTATEENCGNANGTATVVANGGTSPFQYLWSNGDVNAMANGLTAGNYSVTVTDNNGCTAISNTSVTTPPALAIQSSSTGALCYNGTDGTASVNVMGGTSPYAYNWSNGQSAAQAINLSAGTYTVTVTDDDGCTYEETIAVGQAPAINLVINTTDATCGSANGQATVAGNGGTGALSYLWSNGQNTTNISGLSAGAYTITATDGNGCTESGIAALANLGGPAISMLNASDASCNGGNDGTAEVTVNSGNGPYTYQWLPSGGNNAIANGLSAGAYAVNVTDANGCISSLNVNISEPAALNLQLSATQATCGNANGSATVIASGGSGGYQYNWSNGDLTATALSLSAGNYDVTVTDVNGCTASSSVAVNQPSSLVLQSNSTPVTCFNGNDGSAAINANGGSAPYTYLWSNGDMTAQINNIPAGTYTVTVSDVNGCSFSDVVNVNQAPVINLQVSSTHATCGGANGTAQVNGNGGTGVLSYLWAGGQIANSLNGLAAGTYTVTATDGNGCTVSAFANISNLGGPVAAIQNNTAVSCAGGNDGSAAIMVNAGNGPFTYQWQPLGGTSTQANGLSAGNYTVLITDVNGCIGNINITITEPNALNIQLNSTQATCGNANGTLTATVNGGTGVYQYSWSNGSNGSNSINSLNAGNYTVTVTDANNCSANATLGVSNAGGPALAVSNVTPASCYGFADGSASIMINSGNGPFTYSWSPQGGTAANANGLSAGNYTVSVTDVNGCTGQQVIIIQEPAALNLQSTTTPTQCNASNGSAQAQVSGGTGNYSYNWNTGASSDFVNGLASGNYTVTVTDDNGCTASTVLTVSGLPGPVISAVNVTDALCFGDANGSAQVQYNSGSAPYTLYWSNGSSGSNASGLLAGSYTVTVTDNFGCSDAKTFNVQQPAALSVTASPVNMVSCFGGNDASAQAMVSGGSAPYNYTWSNGDVTNVASGLSAGSYTVIVSDQHGCTETQSTQISEPALLTASQLSVNMVSCYGGTNGAVAYTAAGGTTPYSYNWSSGAITANNTGLSAGTYTLTITDGNGCTVSAMALITQPPAINFNTPVISNVSCFNGSNGQISVSNSGGVAPYSYQWSTGAYTSNLSNLPAGTYTVTVTDANACTGIRILNVTQPAAIAIQSVINGIPCFGMNNAAIVVNTSGGVAPYSYSWSNGMNSNNIGSLSPGLYSITITDANNCIFDTSFSITQPPVLQASVANPDTLCIGQSAILNAVVNGGTPAYSYQWSNSNSSNSIQVNPVITASYTLTVTDANGCNTAVNNIQVPVFPALSINLSVSDDSLCEGESTQLYTTVSGGNGGPYTYTWNANANNVSGYTITPDSSYLYSVSISDGCTVIEPFAQQYVVVHPLPVVSFTPIKAEGCNPVTVSFVSTGQTTAGSFYNWNFGDNTDGAGSAVSHTYTTDGTFDVSLQVIDKFGCMNALTQNNIVTVFPLPVAFYTSDPQEVSILHPIVQFINSSTGASSSHWDFGDGTASSFDWSPEHIFGDTGRYKVELIAISNDGCVDTFYNEIIVKGETTFYVPNAFSPNNDGDNEFFTGYGIGIRHADFFIFDRWGKMIYASNSLEKGWNGKYQNNGDDCPEGTYVYLFKVYTGLPAPTEYTGKVTLLR